MAIISITVAIAGDPTSKGNVYTEEWFKQVVTTGTDYAIQKIGGKLHLVRRIAVSDAVYERMVKSGNVDKISMGTNLIRRTT